VKNCDNERKGGCFGCLEALMSKKGHQVLQCFLKNTWQKNTHKLSDMQWWIFLQKRPDWFKWLIKWFFLHLL